MRKLLNILFSMVIVFAIVVPIHAEDDEWSHVTSTHWLLYDCNNGQILSEQGSDEIIYPASLTKLMTAIIALESFDDLYQQITFTEEMLDGLEEANAAVAGYEVGDTAPVIDLIYGDLLASGADCSRAIAFAISGSEEAFVALMNQKAISLGMLNTNYVNTSGLHDDAHVTTCQDLLTLFLYCLENEDFVRISATQDYTTSPVESAPKGLSYLNVALMFINQANPRYPDFNYSIPGFVTGKTGFTNEARYTFASECLINGMDLVLINCGAYVQPHYPASVEDAYYIYRYYRKHWGRSVVASVGQRIDEIGVRNGNGLTVGVTVLETLDLDVPTDGTLRRVYELPASLDAPVTEGDVIGTLSLYDGDTLLAQTSLVATQDIQRTYLGIARTFALEHRYVILGVILVMLALVSVLIKRNK